jgi:hypothetical protein
MRRVLWWTGKEVREHRVVLVLLLVGLVVGTWFWAWSTRGRPGDAWSAKAEAAAVADAPVRHRLERVGDWEAPFVVSLAAVLVSLAGGLFASDLRRGCGPLMARAPGGWGAAFVGKLGFLLAAMVGTYVLHGLVLAWLANRYHLHMRGLTGDVLVDVLWLGPVSDRYVTATYALFAAAPVLVLASMALPYIGVPSVVGVAVALGLALPFAWIHADERFFFEWWLGSIRLLLAVGALGALAVATWVWWAQVRAGRSRLRVAMAGASVVLLGVGATAGAAFAARAEYRDFSLADPDVQILQIAVGSEGRVAFVMAGRGDPSPPPGGLAWRGGREKPFAIDLATGVSKPIAGGAVRGVPTGYAHGSSIDAPAVRVVSRYLPDADGWEFAWLDARTGAEVARTVGRQSNDLPDPVKALLEAGIERRWALEGADGRRAWLDESGLRVRAGDAAPTTTVLELPTSLGKATSLLRIDQGWELRWGPGGAGPLQWAVASGGVASVDALDGRVRHLTLDRVQPRDVLPIMWLSPRDVLLVPGAAAPGVANERARDPRAWRILDLDAGTSRPALREGASVAARLDPQGVLGPTSLLVHDAGASGGLLVLDLGDGQTRPVAWDRDPPARVHRASCMQNQLTPTEAGGALLVDLVVDEASVGPRPDERLPILQGDGWVGGGTTMEGKQRLRHVVGVVGADGSAWRLEARARSYAAQLLGIDAQGRVWMLEDARQIVRYGPGTGVREVLFPRAP